MPDRSLNSDAAYIATVLKSIPGPIVLVGHSYGCAAVAGATATRAASSEVTARSLETEATYRLSS